MAKNRANDHSKYTDWIDPNEVIPYERNAKRHDEKQIKNIANSIRRFGWQQDTVITSDNVLVIGHGRRLAAIKLGCEMPYHRIDKTADELTDEDIRELRIADNQTNSETGYDFDIMTAEIEDLNFEGFDFDFGYDAADTDTAEIIEDDVPELPEEPRAKVGDIYRLGRHRLMCGDSTKADDVEKLINGAKVDMVFTDPPYGMNLDTDFSTMKNHLDFAKDKGFAGGRRYEKRIVDDFDPAMIAAALNIDADEVFLWGADYYAELLPDRNAGSWIVWDKRANGNDDVDEDYASDRMYGSCFELCWSKKRHKRDIARIKWASVFGTEQEPDKRRYHPTQKPVGLSAWFIERFSTEGGSMLDLFGGSGSTLLACEQTGRSCYMMELDPRYCDVIIQRWENLTGERAVLINSADQRGADDI